MMIIKIFFVSILLPLMVVLPSCGKETASNQPIKNFFALNTPILSFGDDDETEKPGAYDSIGNYFVDNGGNVYISDTANFKIDKFHHKGNYLFSFGNKAHDAIQFPGWIDYFVIDTNENLIAYSPAKRKFLLFTSDGKDFRKKDLNIDLKQLRIKKLKIDGNDCLYLLTHSDAMGYQLFKYATETKEYTLIHTDNQRIRPAFKDLPPDFDIDAAGNVYITDTIEYRIFKYSINGQLIDTFSKKVKKLKILEQDFNFLMRQNRVRKIPNYKNAWKELKGASGFFPAIFGIDIDGDRIFVWNSRQDTERKFLVDVYDMNFKYLRTISYYNEIGSNRVYIKNHRFYIPNFVSDDIDLNCALGRFGAFNFPYRIDVYQISKIILNESLN